MRWKWNAPKIILSCTVGQDQWSHCSMQAKKWGLVLQSVPPSRYHPSFSTAYLNLAGEGREPHALLLALQSLGLRLQLDQRITAMSVT